MDENMTFEEFLKKCKEKGFSVIEMNDLIQITNVVAKDAYSFRVMTVKKDDYEGVMAALYLNITESEEGFEKLFNLLET
jgi:hypothetical protein